MTLLLPSAALHLDVRHCPVSCQHHAVHVGHAAAGAEDTVALNTSILLVVTLNYQKD